MNVLIRLLRQGRFQEAMTLFDDQFNQLKTDLEIDTYDHPSQEYYQFMLYMGDNSHNPQLIAYASMLLATSLCHFEAAYLKSYQYASKVVQIEPEPLENWQWLLFYFDLPEKLLSEDEQVNILSHILQRDRHNKQAIAILHQLPEPLQSQLMQMCNND